MALGLDRETGRAIGGFDHLRQSVIDILTTVAGSQVLRRDYGSDYPRLIDRPMNNATLLDTFAAIAAALARWEPRFTLTHVAIGSASAGAMGITLSGRWRFLWPQDVTREVEIEL